jgi:hypothetical protein
MNKFLGLICSAGLTLTLSACGGGGGDDEPTNVFTRYSGDLKCYNALGTFTETANFAFSEESMTLVSVGVRIPLPRSNTSAEGTYGYVGPIAGTARYGAVILNPAGTPLNGTTYPVTFALTYANTSTVNPYSLRACK